MSTEAASPAGPEAAEPRIALFDGSLVYRRIDRALLETGYELLGSGGDQLVFRLANQPDCVLKISHRLLGSSDYNANVMERRFPPMCLDTEARYEQAEAEVLFYRMRYEYLVAAFGQDRVIPESVEAEYIPLNGRTCRQLWQDDVPLEEQEIRWFLTMVRKQHLVPQLLDREAWHTQTLGVGYVERQPNLNAEHYVHVCDTLLDPTRKGQQLSDEDWQAFLALHDNESILSVARLLDDPSFRPVAQDFFTRAAYFTSVTGENLDLQPDNIIFYKDGDTWQYMLVDALYPIPRMTIHETRHILNRHNPTLSDSQKIGIMNALNYARIINAFSRRLQTGAEIDLSSYPLPKEKWQWALEQIQSKIPSKPAFPARYLAKYVTGIRVNGRTKAQYND